VVVQADYRAASWYFNFRRHSFPRFPKQKVEYLDSELWSRRRSHLQWGRLAVQERKTSTVRRTPRLKKVSHRLSRHSAQPPVDHNAKPVSAPNDVCAMSAFHPIATKLLHYGK
jgi:hypothetical protein